MSNHNHHSRACLSHREVCPAHAEEIRRLEAELERSKRQIGGQQRHYRVQCAEFERLVLPLVDKDLRPHAKALFSDADTLVGFEPALVHADLGPEHLLVREGRLAGVIDWGDARLGDPALDYSWLLHGPFAFWDVDPDLRRRARFYHRLAPWYEAHYGLFTNRPTHTERALAGIRDRL